MKEYFTHLLIMTGIVIPTLFFSHWLLISYLMLEIHQVLTGGIIVGYFVKMIADFFIDDE